MLGCYFIWLKEDLEAVRENTAMMVTVKQEGLEKFIELLLSLINLINLFQQFIACDYRTESPALFQNILKFCTFSPKFSNIFPFLIISLPFF